MKIQKYTFGMGDRFGQQGVVQLQAIQRVREFGFPVFPVWNKSNREHTIIGTKPDDLRREADLAVKSCGWEEDYYVDADHIGLRTVDGFLDASNFFTLDVADFSGKSADQVSLDKFASEMKEYTGKLSIPGIAEPFQIDTQRIMDVAGKFLYAMQEAGRIYRHIENKKGRGNFITEVSVDETDTAQNPVELLLILAMLAKEGVPVETIAPKFTGRFNKGVDYVGDPVQFEKEFDEDLCVLSFAVREFGLPETLKLSVHSGSDKFSLYPIIRRLIRKHDAGLHIKTAGTTWLEEVIGLAESGGEGLKIAKEIYNGAFLKAADLIAPYASVVDIDLAKLPDPSVLSSWSSEEFVAVLRHDPANTHYNPQFRQFIHVSFKVAAKMGGRYVEALRDSSEIVGRNVGGNLFERHMKPLFL